MGSRPAIALNMWSHSAERGLMEGILAQPVPFEPEWDDATLRAAGTAYFDLLLVASFADDAQRAPAGALGVKAALRRRYDTLVPGESARQDPAPGPCGRAAPGAIDTPKAKARAARVGEMFQGIRRLAVRTLYLATYAERLALAIGGAESLLDFVPCLYRTASASATGRAAP